MTAASAGVVSLDVARLAVDVANLKGEQALLASQVSQSIATLTTLVHEVQADQLRARDERHAQTLMLSTLTERAAVTSTASARMRDLELKVSHWRGVFIGFSLLATLVVGGAVAWVSSQLANGAHERGKLETRIERLEQRPTP